MRAASLRVGSSWLGAFAGLCFLFLRGAGSLAAEASRPNIVVILADDLGWGDLGCYGHQKFKTPSLDKMAAEGARLTSFHATCPYCAPSRASLLTGRYQFRCGITGNPTPDAGIDDIGIPATEVTLAEALRESGYKTICIGKWHLGHKPEFYPTRHGFDEYLGILYSNDMRPVELVDGEKVVEYPVVQTTLTKRYTARALDFMERSKGEPFFLYLPHAMPHKPLVPSEDFYRKTGTGLYGDTLAELDRSVGQVLAKIRELGLDDRTLTFFTSDNGPWYGGSTGGFRGMKGTSWEGGFRVPLLVRWPGRIPAGHVSAEPAMMPDVFATALAAAGVPVPADRVIDGKDIFPLLTSGAKSPHDAIFGMRGTRLSVVLSGKWKLHVERQGKPRIWKKEDPWEDPRAPDGVTILAPYEQAHPSEYPGALTGDDTKAATLFNLEADASEQRDVSREHPDVVKRLQALHEEMKKQIPPPAAREKS